MIYTRFAALKMSCKEVVTSNHVTISVGDPTRKKLNEYRSREVAEELCLMDSELLRKIEPAELQNGAWMKKTRSVEERRVEEREREVYSLYFPAEVLPRPQHNGHGELLQSAGSADTFRDPRRTDTSSQSKGHIQLHKGR